ncbi:MAG: type IV secretory system conjugative DNA transfer family protein [Bacilli bacterium]
MFKNVKKDTYILIIIGYFFFIFLSLHVVNAFNNIPDFNIEKIELLSDTVVKNISDSPFRIEFDNKLLKAALVSSFAYLIGSLYYLTTRKKFRLNVEHGSAEWSKDSDIKNLIDSSKSDKNIIFTNKEKLALDTRKTRKNLNVLILGGSGAGKTRFYAKPNIMQSNTSFVVTDPKGEILRDTGKMLENKGYVVKVFNLIDMKLSHKYNPFFYIKKESDIPKLINNLIRNTTPKESSSSDPFWEKAETTLLQAVFYYIYHEGRNDEKNFEMVIKLIRLASASEEDESMKSDLDLLFEKLEEENPDHIALKPYKDFKKAAGKTAKSILISALARLTVFNTDELIELTNDDELELEKIGDRKTALFVVIPDSDTTYNFIVSMMYQQLFNILYYEADFNNGGRLKNHVRFILDEFANIGQIPDFEKLVATMRSREISVNIIIQNLAQIKTMYKDSWESITGNCDSFLFLGGQEQSTLEYISKKLGKETIDTRNYNYSKGRNGSSTQNNNIVGRELMTPDEIGKMPDSKCILFIRGIKPFYSDKFKIEKHKNYKLIGDYNQDNNFDINSLNINKRSICSRFEEVKKETNTLFTIKDLEMEIKSIEDIFIESEYGY